MSCSYLPFKMWNTVQGKMGKREGKKNKIEEGAGGRWRKALRKEHICKKEEGASILL